MKFTPLKDDQLELEKKPFLLDPGEYNFKVMTVTDKPSKSGNDMITLNLELSQNNVTKGYVYDYLLEKLSYKLKHFCECVGLKSEYLRGELEANKCEDKRGKLTLSIQKDKTGNYPDKNMVKDYIVSESINSDEFIEDQIPF